MMETRKMLRSVIKEEFIMLTGDYRLALVLNQMLYWSQFTKDFDHFIEEERKRRNDPDLETCNGWIFKTAEELSEETMLNVAVKTMRHYLKTLVASGWLSERRNPHHSWDHTRQYRVNLGKLQKDLLEIGFFLDGYRVDLNFLREELQIEPPVHYDDHLIILEEFDFDEAESLDIPFAVEDENVKTTAPEENSTRKNETTNVQNATTIPEITSETTTEITKEHIAGIVDYLNEQTGKNFQAKTAKTQSLIQARWKEGHQVEDFKKVIDTKTANWLEDPEMNKFLRPETLFGTKFESYLYERGSENRDTEFERYLTGLA
ncbi:conserved phage C-terminal domain-containing protein [Evansella sp. LMS18]|uniref:conserved phage C-terminal domain-containing protein n=1 Tax=Evansella sp. LMS18 TaxID=2924033 RepID=UPI0020D090FE|nr:conserved phage C-terminal domain-containing protein [Evansella sp. LMS18]UTR12736.1 conserved phage C-terminal domain-containing protein [Evansella sp. LMS18]